MSEPRIPDGVVEVRIDCGSPADDDRYYVTITHDGVAIFIKGDDGAELQIRPGGAHKLGEALIAFANMMERYE